MFDLELDVFCSRLLPTDPFLCWIAARKWLSVFGRESNIDESTRRMERNHLELEERKQLINTIYEMKNETFKLSRKEENSIL